jgi:hypothetical protein
MGGEGVLVLAGWLSREDRAHNVCLSLHEAGIAWLNGVGRADSRPPGIATRIVFARSEQIRGNIYSERATLEVRREHSSTDYRDRQCRGVSTGRC